MRPYHQIALDYANQVLDETLPACKWVKLACQRFLVDLERDDWFFDQAKADRVCGFIELLPHTKAEWANKKELIVLQPWQIFILQNVFGFVNKLGHRRFNQSFVVCPRKNGKSLFSAAVGVYMLVADGEFGAEVYCGATTEKQAYEVFDPARLICKNTPNLLKHVRVNTKAISRASDGSKFHPLVGSPGDGSMPHFAILDERHEHTDNTLRDAMRTGMGTRRQGLMWTVTTAGFDLASPCYDDVIAGRSILDGTLESDRWFYIEYTIDEDDDWTTKEAAMKANPNYGISIYESYLEDERKNAINIASQQNAYKTKYLCLWTQAKNAFHNIQKWNENLRPDIQLEDYKHRTVILGLDLAAKQDICAIAILIPNGDGTFTTFGKFYIPSDAVNQPGRSHLITWRARDKIMVFDGNMVDFDHIERDIDELMTNYDVQKIVFDVKLASMMEQHLMEKGYPLESFVQSAMNYTEPMRWIDGLINENKLYHNSGQNDPATWMMANVQSKTNKRDMEFPDKERAENKIDYPVALYMAAAECLSTPVATFESLFIS